MRRRLREWISMKAAKQPGTVVLLAILLFNVVFFLLSALIVSSFSVTGTEKMGFLEAAFYTITMILDAGCIQFVLDEVGQVGVSVVLICIGIIIVGMITFKEIYAKKVSRFFEEIPPRCTARELIRAVYEASADERLPASQRNPAIVLGYVKPGGEMVLFQGDQEEIWVELTERDKLIVFSNH